LVTEIERRAAACIEARQREGELLELIVGASLHAQACLRRAMPGEHPIVPPRTRERLEALRRLTPPDRWPDRVRRLCAEAAGGAEPAEPAALAAVLDQVGG
jgi:hypothetical protein